jgi:hypothetical protein
METRLKKLAIAALGSAPGLEAGAVVSCDMGTPAEKTKPSPAKGPPIPGLKSLLDSHVWLRIEMPGGLVAFVRTEQWLETVSWWIREGMAEKLGEGVIWAEPYPVHLEALISGLGSLDPSGPWVLATNHDIERWGRA